VIVFTHDTRLPHAIAHLGIEATVMQVSRQTDSVVGVETATDPVKQALDEARVVAKDPNLPPDVADQVLPAMCRVALEAACLATARRRLRDEQGLGLRAVEERVANLERTKEYVSLALLGDEQQSARGAVEQLCPGGWALIETFNSGTHTPLPTVADRGDLVRRTKALAAAIRRGAAPGATGGPAGSDPAAEPASPGGTGGTR
jgi:hypothetical protein